MHLRYTSPIARLTARGVTMEQADEQQKASARGDARISLALIALCFTLTSEAWLGWHYHLIQLTTPLVADTIAMVAGYLCQAAGMGIAAFLARRKTGVSSRIVMACTLAGHFACALVASLGTNLLGTVAFGLLMNLLCGVIAEHYLLSLAQQVASNRRGTTFGVAYALSTLVTWLLSHLVVSTSPAMVSTLAVQGTLSLSALVVIFRMPETDAGQQESVLVGAPVESPAAGVRPIPFGNQVVLLASLTVLFMSLVKNIGFSFPSSDLAHGVSVETSRLFYAVGLVAAGIVNDRQRSWGAFLCTAALVTPFALLAVSCEPVPATMLWAADYFFYGFFSVYRVVLFGDLAATCNKASLACQGLLFGRLGDALGTALCQSLSHTTVVLVPLAAALFAVALLVVAQLFPLLYLPAHAEPAAPPRSEEDTFDAFSLNHGLSRREREVLRQVLAEHTNAEAAAELFVTEATIKYHVHNLLKKTECKNRNELLALYARERGL